MDSSLTNFYITLLLIDGLIFGFFCSFIAKQKNRDASSWFWLGFFFSFIALIALISVPKVESKRERKLIITCTNCGMRLREGEKSCPNCGGDYFVYKKE
jgi:hypothetical protein